MEAITNRVASASQLLAQNATNEAFIEYLGCMCLVASQLSQSKGLLLFASTQSAFDGISQSVSTLFSYARQCLDQSEMILKQEIDEMQEQKLGAESVATSKRASKSLSGSTSNSPNSSTISSTTSATSSNLSSSAAGSRLSTGSTGSVGEGEAKVGVATKVDEDDDMRKKLQNAMREAQEKNVVLLQKYQARIDKIKQTYGEGNPQIQAQLSDLSLKFSREYAENYQIAKQTQQSILQQIESRRKNIQNLQRASVDSLYQERHNPLRVLALFKNDAKTQRICREMDAEWRKLLTIEGVSERTVLNYLGHILGLAGHPLGKEAAKLVDHCEVSLLSLPASHDPDVFKEKVSTVRNMLHAISDMIMTTYPELESKGGESVRMCVDLVLFPRFFPPLFEWFIQKTAEEDAILDKKYQIFMGVLPSHIGVRKMFWLHDEKAKTVPDPPPYLKAIDHLRRLSSMTNTSSKMQCMIETSKAVIDCASKYYEGRMAPGQIVIGADDLVPILAYVIIKAAVRNIHAEMSLIEEFMDESLMIGEHGYCLSTFQTCMFYIQSLDWREADQQHTDLQK